MMKRGVWWGICGVLSGAWGVNVLLGWIYGDRGGREGKFFLDIN